MDYGLGTMTAETFWQSEYAHTRPPTSELTVIFTAALHHWSHCHLNACITFKVVGFSPGNGGKLEKI